MSVTCLVEGTLCMKDFYIQVHETFLQMRVSCYRSQELGKDAGSSGQRGVKLLVCTRGTKH